MKAYVIRPTNSIYTWNWRNSAFHRTVYHGISHYPNREPGTVARWPSIEDPNRDTLHVIRSGRFVPEVFGKRAFVVSDHLRSVLADVPGMQFADVVFEHLVDMPMPPLGDFSWFDRDDLALYESHPDNLMKSLPDVPEFHQSIGSYSAILPASLSALRERLTDIEEVPVDFGNYLGRKGWETVELSQELLEQYPVVRAPLFVFREDAFMAMAPLLNLDYYTVSVCVFGNKPGPRFNPFNNE